MSREGSHSFYRAASGVLAVLHLVCEFAPPNMAAAPDAKPLATPSRELYFVARGLALVSGKSLARTMSSNRRRVI